MLIGKRLTIPDIRERMFLLADLLEVGAVNPGHAVESLRALARATKRRVGPRQRARPRQAPITLALVAEVRAFCAAHPGMAQRDIGRTFYIDGGRVNEILNGFADGTSYEAYLAAKVMQTKEDHHV